MEWIISGIIALLLSWCIYCIMDYYTSWTYYNWNSFKELKTFSKIVYITYQIVSWTTVIGIAGVLFILITMCTKALIFG
jgi:hypothetical protein